MNINNKECKKEMEKILNHYVDNQNEVSLFVECTDMNIPQLRATPQIMVGITYNEDKSKIKLLADIDITPLKEEAEENGWQFKYATFDTDEFLHLGLEDGGYFYFDKWDDYPEDELAEMENGFHLSDTNCLFGMLLYVTNAGDYGACSFPSQITLEEFLESDVYHMRDSCFHTSYIEKLPKKDDKDEEFENEDVYYYTYYDGWRYVAGICYAPEDIIFECKQTEKECYMKCTVKEAREKIEAE